MRRYLSATFSSTLLVPYRYPSPAPSPRYSSPSSLSPTTPVRMASTLHKGVVHDEEKTTHSGVGDRSRLGADYVVKSGVPLSAAEQSQRDGGASSTGKVREDQSFESMLRVIEELTSRPPNRVPDNVAVTRMLMRQLNLLPHNNPSTTSDGQGSQKNPFEEGSPMHFVHIAGTKGKGTTAAYTAALLQSYGYKVGLFTSPHLIDFRERILVDNSFLSKEEFSRYFFEFKAKHDALVNSPRDSVREAVTTKFNFFRFVFLLSLYIFEKESVQIAVMEVGLGGRLDATNALDTTDVSVITSLGFDHTELLGNTIESIAEEKAGIMKEGVICYAAPQVDHPSTRKVLEAAALRQKAALILLDPAVLPIHYWPTLAIGGSHAVEDSKLALMAARKVANIPPFVPLDESEKHVLRTLTFAGRSQVIPVNGGEDMTLYLDGAHTNESLGRALEWFIAESAERTKDPHCRRAVLFYSSRDPKRILKAFMPFTASLCKIAMAQIEHPKIQQYASQYQRSGSSAGTMTEKEMAEEAAQKARQELVEVTTLWREMYREVVALPCATPFRSIEDISDLLVPPAGETEDATKPVQVLVCGSFYLVGEILALVERSGREKQQE